jgi:hypothetical protein
LIDIEALRRELRHSGEGVRQEERKEAEHEAGEHGQDEQRALERRELGEWRRLHGFSLHLDSPKERAHQG